MMKINEAAIAKVIADSIDPDDPDAEAKIKDMADILVHVLSGGEGEGQGQGDDKGSTKALYRRQAKGLVSRLPTLASITKAEGETPPAPPKKKSKLRKAYQSFGKTYVTVKEMMQVLGVDGDTLVRMLDNNMVLYDISAEIAQKRSEGSVRWRGRPIGIIVVSPKRPPAVVDGYTWV